MENIERVTAHFARRRRPGLTLVPTREGATALIDARGDWWRMYRFIEGAVTHGDGTSVTPAAARAAGRAFGEFQQALADYDGPRLHDTIPHFHDTVRRYAAFERAVDAAPLERRRAAATEIAFARTQQRLAGVLVGAITAGRIPERIVHNDAKVSNLLFDAATGAARCVVDLDTVMPGLAPADFGDLIRSTACPAAEDERELGRVVLDRAVFEAVADGYVNATRDFLTREERALLVPAVLVITYEQGLRFLTDWLESDRYYRTTRPGQNLDRCRTQFRLLEGLLAAESALTSVAVGL